MKYRSLLFFAVVLILIPLLWQMVRAGCARKGADVPSRSHGPAPDLHSHLADIPAPARTRSFSADAAVAERVEGEAPSVRRCQWYAAAEPVSFAAPYNPARPPVSAPCGVMQTRCAPGRATCCPPAEVTGVDSAACIPCGEPGWNMRGPIPWEFFAQGEYVGPARDPHVFNYRLRADDELELVFRLTRERSPTPYELTVGDRVRIESLADPNLDRDLIVQPDGTITVRLLGQVIAAGRTTEELREDLEELYEQYYKVPSITVTPLVVNTRLEDLRATVDSRQGLGGQARPARVTPDGTIQLPGLGSVPANGLTLDELKAEIDARYAEIVTGIEVTPVLTQRAPRFIYVVGEVRNPGRFNLSGPTTVMQSIALAGGWNVGANLRQIVVFRRADDWRLLATKLDLRGALYAKRPAPSDEIWLRDSDLVLVPKCSARILADSLDLVFPRGFYTAFPFLTDGLIFTNGSVF